ncbi:MAG: hypothetical protein E6J52_03480 [Chloroflexi bacterium]|nr:MAG: hypothetical protein E6J52_03480 [Chloroflexota bacterium]
MRATTLSAFLFAFLAAALAMLQAPSDSDMFWHLEQGDWTISHGMVLTTDIWSFTRAGATYNTGAWLGDVVMSTAYGPQPVTGTFSGTDSSGLGWLGLDILRAVLVGFAAFFTARITLRVQPHLGWAAVPVLGTILVSRMVWGDRPQLFTLALFPLVLDLLFAWRLEGRTRALVALPFVFVLWANLHNAFVIGLVAVAIFAIDAWLEGERRMRVPALATLVACVVATQLNPAGGGAVARAAAYGALLPGWIVEDRALDVLSGAGLVFATLLLAAIAAAMLRGREGIAARLGAPLLWPGLIAPFTVLALAIQRETPYACMVLAPFVAAMVPDAIGRPRIVAPVVPRVIGLAIVVVLAVALALEAALAAPREPDLGAYPVGAVPLLGSLQGRPHLLNEYDWGGYLIRYAPTYPTFIDGRGEAVFVPDVLSEFQRVVALAPGYRDVLKKWDIALVLLRPDRPLVGALREDGWRVLGEDARWVMLSRP